VLRRYGRRNSFDSQFIDSPRPQILLHFCIHDGTPLNSSKERHDKLLRTRVRPSQRPQTHSFTPFRYSRCLAHLRLRPSLHCVGSVLVTLPHHWSISTKLSNEVQSALTRANGVMQARASQCKLVHVHQRCPDEFSWWVTAHPNLHVTTEHILYHGSTSFTRLPRESVYCMRQFLRSPR
jgi:hypothetical protein